MAFVFCRWLHSAGFFDFRKYNPREFGNSKFSGEPFGQESTEENQAPQAPGKGA
jgi:hypothetical protein